MGACSSALGTEDEPVVQKENPPEAPTVDEPEKTSTPRKKGKKKTKENVIQTTDKGSEKQSASEDGSDSVLFPKPHSSQYFDDNISNWPSDSDSDSASEFGSSRGPLNGPGAPAIATLTPYTAELKWHKHAPENSPRRPNRVKSVRNGIDHEEAGSYSEDESSVDVTVLKDPDDIPDSQRTGEYTVPSVVPNSETLLDGTMMSSMSSSFSSYQKEKKDDHVYGAYIKAKRKSAAALSFREYLTSRSANPMETMDEDHAVDPSAYPVPTSLSRVQPVSVTTLGLDDSFTSKPSNRDIPASATTFKSHSMNDINEPPPITPTAVNPLKLAAHWGVDTEEEEDKDRSIGKEFPMGTDRGNHPEARGADLAVPQSPSVAGTFAGMEFDAHKMTAISPLTVNPATDPRNRTGTVLEVDHVGPDGLPMISPLTLRGFGEDGSGKPKLKVPDGKRSKLKRDKLSSTGHTSKTSKSKSSKGTAGKKKKKKKTESIDAVVSSSMDETEISGGKSSTANGLETSVHAATVTSQEPTEASGEGKKKKKEKNGSVSKRGGKSTTSGSTKVKYEGKTKSSTPAGTDSTDELQSLESERSDFLNKMASIRDRIDKISTSMSNLATSEGGAGMGSPKPIAVETIDETGHTTKASSKGTKSSKKKKGDKGSVKKGKTKVTNKEEGNEKKPVRKVKRKPKDA
eukprot:Nitzschia sp. Nitz4//scaffold110_size71422//16915//18969//NITZ4_005866-RA/size71422-processed-gene-0.68-mRNA-1//-1//CDS//3329533065//8639//frame0